MNDSVMALVFSQTVAGADGEGVVAPLPVTYFGRRLALLRSSSLVYLIRRGATPSAARWSRSPAPSSYVTEIHPGHINKDDG